MCEWFLKLEFWNECGATKKRGPLVPPERIIDKFGSWVKNPSVNFFTLFFGGDGDLAGFIQYSGNVSSRQYLKKRSLNQ